MKKMLVLLSLVVLAAGCAWKPAAPIQPANTLNTVHEKVLNSSSDLYQMQQKLRDDMQQKEVSAEPVLPMLPVYDPLDDHIVSFSMADESVHMVLYSLAKSVGMNLILDPEVKKEDRALTLNFENVSASKVLREILSTFDLFHEIEDNVLRIRPYQEKIFYLNFLNAEIDTEFAVGGDVLGASDENSIGALAGNFKVTGRSSGRSNPYDVLVENVRAIISEKGKYTVNRMAGSLYVKDKPAVLTSIARMINHFKEMVNRQILIEARIIEVSLTDEHRYGINWTALRDEAANVSAVTATGWNVGQGIVFSHQEGKFALNSIIEFLDSFGDSRVISNPSIRSKHSQPAIISVGTSFTYKKSIETTRTSSGSSDDISTEVEVSTVFDGLILGVIPFIEEDGKISLIINPIKSDVDRESLEPEDVGVAGSGLSISLPEVLIKEISTTICLNNNDVAVLGGLIDQRKVLQDDNVPGLSKIPILGYLFRNKVQVEEARELVIILSVSMV
ncbi:MAG: pilus (MSHA type) biogenesis protein MshL [Desulfobacteraceae bacterium]|nr:pilus (MSHA type) biogenesis protein MshL [Desulfobacteraceae bacterium]